jgi:hypothetical protein
VISHKTWESWDCGVVMEFEIKIDNFNGRRRLEKSDAEISQGKINRTIYPNIEIGIECSV